MNQHVRPAAVSKLTSRYQATVPNGRQMRIPRRTMSYRSFDVVVVPFP